jgi:hypothetical protein
VPLDVQAKPVVPATQVPPVTRAPLDVQAKPVRPVKLVYKAQPATRVLQAERVPQAQRAPLAKQAQLATPASKAPLALPEVLDTQALQV